jgi:predicted nucleic acid-binding protein
VVHVLRRKIRTGIISTAQASEAVARVKTAFKHLVPSIDLIDVAFDLSSTMDHSIYDAMYLACALDDADDILVTADRKFAAKASAAGFDNKIRILGAALPGSTSPQENNHG